MLAAPTHLHLAGAASFVEVAQTALLAVVPMLGALAGAIDAGATLDHPLACVAGTYFDTATLQRYLDRGFQDDPCRAAVAQHPSPVLSTELLGPRQRRELAAAHGCLDGTARHIIVGALIGEAGVLGTLRVASERALPGDARDLVSSICTQVSVRLAHIGFTAAGLGATGDRGALAALTSRQRDVARLVARGFTNAAIARALAVTDNAVKKHLKRIAVALDLANRAELAALVSRGCDRGDHLDPGRLLPGFQLLRAAAGG